MRYMFDTDTCISLLDNREPEKQRNILARLDKLRQEDVALSSITVSELVFGAENGQYRKTNLEALELFLLDLQVLPFDFAAAREAGAVRARLEKVGRRIGVMDTLIAGHAKATRLTVVTNNVAHFGNVKGLKVENWSV
jgi:tRNA(fMet)-specific endonuclease VapC